ncbi:MAG: permease [Alphaproteobacteria bacterium]
MGRTTAPSDGKPAWRRACDRAFDRTFFAFAALAVIGGMTTYWLKGADIFERSLDGSLELLWFILPRIGAAMIIAAFLQVLIPRELVARLIGEQAGARSVFIATIAGALTPGGPLTCFPIIVALHASGANKGALVAYLLSWAMLGIQRIVVWEIPLMGADFTILRVTASFTLPVIAGLIALRLPIRIRVPDQPGRGA